MTKMNKATKTKRTTNNIGTTQTLAPVPGYGALILSKTVFGPRVYEDDALVGSSTWVWTHRDGSPSYPKAGHWLILSRKAPQITGFPVDMECFIVVRDDLTDKERDFLLYEHSAAQSLQEARAAIPFIQETLNRIRKAA